MIDLGLGQQLIGVVSPAQNAYRDIDRTEQIYRGRLESVGEAMAATLVRNTLLALVTITAVTAYLFA